MSNSKMLIDAAHPEETRVVVLKGNRVEEFDFEAANKKQLRGNIYLAKVTRVEPSLQAAFVEYGGNRHGFLAFSEIHPDYYQIPYADRQALLEEEARAHRDEDDEGRGDRGSDRGDRGGDRGSRGERSERADRQDRGARGERSSGGDRGERTSGGERGERGHRRSRRHRRDGTVAALEQRGQADDFVSESAEAGLEHDTALTAVGFLPDDAAEVETGAVEGDALAGHLDSEAVGEGVAAPEHPLVEDGDEPLPEHPLVAAVGSALSPDLDAAPARDLGPEPTLAPDVVTQHDEAERSHFSPGPDLSADPAPQDVEALPPVDDAAAEPAVLGEPEGLADAAGDLVQDESPDRPEPVTTAYEAPLPEHEDAPGRDHEDEHVEQIGGDALEDVAPRPARLRRHYKIQEVIKRRQILLIQVVKEERGNKGAALTTYLSLAGRYSVLMPNTARGGGISRKITDGEDRKRLKAIAQELDVPEGMGVILRTAGASRTNSEVKRDFEYLLRMWESVRELTLKSTAPTLVYEEGSLIKRSIRDLYNRDVEDVLVSGEEGYREARDFMRMLMPGNAESVKLYRDPQPIFAKSGVESQLDAMFSNHVTLKSGGYLVINQTEALVAIDVNSGRSTREHNIEDTALRTNLEAADEVARQLRLRDLAGLIVVDFIDMDEGRNNRAVERRIKEALKNDRARIQIGRISHFGLLEMSRQRIRTGVLEGSTVVCPHCAGAGTVRSTASIALHVLRLLEDALIKDASHDLIVRSRNEVALYVLNQKRAKLVELEQRFGVTISVLADPTLTGMIYHAIERGELATPALAPAPRRDLVRVDSVAPIFDDEAEENEVGIEGGDETEGSEDETSEAESGSADPADPNRRRRRRRRRRGRDRDALGEAGSDASQAPAESYAATMAGDQDQPSAEIFRAEGEVAEDTAADMEGDAPVREPARADEASDLTAVAFTAPAEQIAPSTDAVEAIAPLDQDGVDEEAPRRRRSRRTVARAADASSEAPSVDEAAPAPRRRRAPRSRAAEAVAEMPTAAEALPDNLIGQSGAASRPEADGDIGTDAVEHQTPPTAEAGSPAPAATTEPLVTETSPATRPAAASAAAEPPPAAEPDRPKRSGWWQRAKASFGS